MQPPATPEGRTLVNEPFDDRSWAEFSGQGWAVGYAEGRYRIRVEAGLGPIWSYRTGPGGDASYAVTVQASGEAGLLVRFRDEQDYLMGVLDSAAGTYRIVHKQGSALSTLASGTSTAIQTGERAPNRIEARLKGSTLTMLANGVLLAEADIGVLEDRPRYGLVAIGAGAPAEALFDDLEIRALE
jgi:hypothetical protein